MLRHQANKYTFFHRWRNCSKSQWISWNETVATSAKVNAGCNILGCSESCQNGNSWCSRWWHIRQHDDIFVSLKSPVLTACEAGCVPDFVEGPFLFVEIDPLAASRAGRSSPDRELWCAGLVRLTYKDKIKICFNLRYMFICWGIC